LSDRHGEDADLIAQAKRGDAAAFDLLVLKYQDDLFNGVRRLARNYQDAQDIVQETFIRAYRGIDHFRGASSFFTWLFAIAMHSCIAQRRKRSARKEDRHVPLGSSSERSGPELGDPKPESNPGVAVERRELYERIEQAIGRLEGMEQTLVVLRDLQGFSYEEIETLTGLPRGTLKSKLHRARCRLRDDLKEVLR